MSHSPYQHTRRGMGAMTGAMACFVANDTLVKLTSSALPVSQMMVIRGCVATLLVLSLMSAGRELPALRKIMDLVVMTRAVFEAVIAITFISALALMPQGDITAIIMTAPLLIAVAGVVIFRDRVSVGQWLAILAGFVGTVLVIQPGKAGGLGWPVLLALAAAVSIALRDLVTRRLPSGITSLTVTCATTLMVLLGALLYAPFEEWKPLALADFVRLAGAGVALTAGNYLMILSFRDTDISAVAPFRYTMVGWALIAGYLVFGDVPDLVAGAGILIIVVSGLYAFYVDRRHRV